MNTKKNLKHLLCVLCVALCLTLAAAGISEGELKGQNGHMNSENEQSAIVVKPSETIYFPPSTDTDIISVGPSETIYPGNLPIPSTQPGGGASTGTQTSASSSHGSGNRIIDPSYHGKIVVDGIVYQLKDGLITVVKVKKEAVKDGTLVIPDKIANYQGTVQYIYEEAFAEVRNDMTSVELPETITFIWNGAFTGCNALQTIHFRGTETQWKDLSRWVILPEGCTVECSAQ